MQKIAHSATIFRQIQNFLAFTIIEAHTPMPKLYACALAGAQDMRAVIRVLQLQTARAKLLHRDVAHAIGDLLETGHLRAGPLLDLHDRVSRPEQALRVSGVEPCEILPELHDAQRLPLEIDVVDRRDLQLSARGELEITAVNNVYLERQALRVVKLGQDFTWLDAGNAQSLLRSANTVMQIQQRTGTQVACLEEIAYRMGYITMEQLRARGLELKNTDYGAHILRTCESAGV